MNGTTDTDMQAPAVDVAVVGSGIAGSAAALHAARAGAKVLLIEKLDAPGGSTALSAGMFWTAPDLPAYEARVPLGDPALAGPLIADYADCLEELRALGVRVADEAIEGIMTFGIGYSTDIGAILERSWNEIRERGGEILVSTAAQQVLTDGARVVGLLLRQSDGSLLRCEASSVVLATGGFQGDPALRKAHMGPNADRLVLRSNPGSVGDGLRMARAAGAGGSTAMGAFYGHLLPYPMRKFETEDFLPYSQYYSSETVLVNLHGKRFADEKSGDEILNQSILHQPEARGVLVFDEYIRRTEATSEPFPGLGVNDRMLTAIEAGAHYCSAGTLEELVRRIGEWGIDRENLGATLAAYRSAVAAGERTALGVAVSPAARLPEEAPFHAVMVQPSITFTFGGIPVDDRARALDADGRPIPGLFAAGSDIGGLSNEGYAGGLAPGYITGRWAGRSAAENGGH